MQKKFEERIEKTLGGPLTAGDLRVLQVNVGYRCNMACRHCHVVAGPNRSEVMEKDTVDQVLAVLKKYDIKSLDLTGGAPELNPHFTYFVTEARKTGCHIIARSNLTVLFEKGYEHLPEFYCEHDIEITASLPFYLESNVDRVRGDGTFEKSIRAIQMLNSLGYGDGSDMRRLNLVYNPSGTFLAPSQQCLEEEYRRQLGAHHNVSFNRLFVFSNMPVGRFKDHLEKTGSLEKYLNTLEDSYNPSTLDSLMCRHLISVGWDGALYDCDFNQVLDLHMQDPSPRLIRDFDIGRLAGRSIRTGDHCYCCTAGQGST
ncbi:MAG: arsenosugar biosynthesis radical SAM (seleno)protein ArsS [Thermodesulfovibrionales bacterium]